MCVADCLSLPSFVHLQHFHHRHALICCKESKWPVMKCLLSVVTGNDDWWRARISLSAFFWGYECTNGCYHCSKKVPSISFEGTFSRRIWRVTHRLSLGLFNVQRFHPIHQSQEGVLKVKGVAPCVSVRLYWQTWASSWALMRSIGQPIRPKEVSKPSLKEWE